MGGATSKQPAAVQPVVIRGEPPSRNTTIEGLSISASQGCRSCRLVIPQGSSAASVRMYREFGAIQKSECDRYKQDVARVRAGQLAWDEFKSNLNRGIYYEERTPGFCSQLMADATELGKVTTLEALPSIVRYPRIRKIAEDGGFSAETKLFLIPNIPFQFSFNGQTITASKLALYHPCPLRVENSQYDAVLTLNDPGDATRPAVVLMIPIKGDVSPGLSGTFFERIASAIPGILQPSQPTGQYDPIDVPTGSNWNLSLLLSGRGTSGGTAINTGYFAWSAVPDMEEYLEVDTPYLKRYGWKPRSDAGPTYIMLKDPVSISPYDLQTLTLLPVTPSERAIHVPLSSSIVYQPSQTGSEVTGCSSSRESFTDKSSPECDPFALLPQKAEFTGASLMQTLLGLILPIAIAFAVYWAIRIAGGPAGEMVLRWADSAGRWMATGARATGTGISAAAGTGAAALGRGLAATGSALGTAGSALGSGVSAVADATGYKKLSDRLATRRTRRLYRTGGPPSKFSKALGTGATAIRSMPSQVRSSLRTGLDELRSRRKPAIKTPVAATEESKIFDNPMRSKAAKRMFSKGAKVVINKAKHPGGVVTRGGRKQRGGAYTQCLGTPDYDQVGTIIDVDMDEPNGRTVLVECTSRSGKRVVDWYDPDDLLPYEGPDGDVVVPAAPIATIQAINADILTKYPNSGEGPDIIEIDDKYGVKYSDDEYASVNTSTHKYDCLVQSFLIGVSPNFRRLKQEDKNAYADWFRRVEMPKHYTEADRSKPINQKEYSEWTADPPVFLSDLHAQKLASEFKINILMFEANGVITEIDCKGCETKPFIFIYNPGDGHYRPIRRKKDGAFIFSRGEADRLRIKPAPAGEPGAGTGLGPAVKSVIETLRDSKSLAQSFLSRDTVADTNTTYDMYAQAIISEKPPDSETLWKLLNNAYAARRRVGVSREGVDKWTGPLPTLFRKISTAAPAAPAGEPGAGTGLGPAEPARAVKKRIIAPEPPDEEEPAPAAPPAPERSRSAKAKSDARKAAIEEQRRLAETGQPKPLLSSGITDEDLEREFQNLGPPPGSTAPRIPPARPEMSPVSRGLGPYRAPTVARRSVTESVRPPPEPARVPPARPEVSPVSRGLEGYRAPTVARRAVTESAKPPVLPPHKRGVTTTAIPQWSQPSSARVPSPRAADARGLEQYVSPDVKSRVASRFAEAYRRGPQQVRADTTGLGSIQAAQAKRFIAQGEGEKFVRNLGLQGKPPQFGRGRKRKQTRRR